MDHLLEIKRKATKLGTILSGYKGNFNPVVELPPLKELMLLDLSRTNSALSNLSLASTKEFDSFILQLLEENKASVAVGGYLEHRVIYRRSELFQGEDSRFIHLGIDIWAPAFSPVYAPLEGTIHSFKDNEGFGDYGPTIILEHQLEDFQFYTLYGHLSKRSLEKIKKGQEIKKGEHFTELGPFPENGDWPAHLHFQIMMELEGRIGDFPGVASPSELEKYKILCPDPNLILNISLLENSITS